MAQTIFTSQIIPVPTNLDDEQRTRAAALLIAKDILGAVESKRLVFLASFITGGIGAYMATRKVMRDEGKDVAYPDSGPVWKTGETMLPYDVQVSGGGPYPSGARFTHESAVTLGDGLLTMFEGIPDEEDDGL